MQRPQAIKHILSVSYDENLLITRRLLLEKQGYRVTSALGFVEALARCQQDGFDLFILGHSIPALDKERLVKTFRATCDAPILTLQRHAEMEFQSGDYRALAADPTDFLKAVAGVFAQRATLH